MRRDALLLDGDGDPLDVVLRRTGALLEDLTRLGDESDFAADAAALAALRKKASDFPPGAAGRRALFPEACRLRRRIAFSNPLLDFDRIIFLTHHKQGKGDRHMVDQYYGHNARPGGGVRVLEDAWGEKPTVRDVLADVVVERGRLKGARLTGGSFISLDLDYDAKSILFAWTRAAAPPPASAWKCEHWSAAEAGRARRGNYFWGPDTCYHVFRANVSGAKAAGANGASGLVQLTDGSFNDFDPCFLPSGRIAFVSERRGGYLRCGARPCPTFTLHGMMPDGSDIIPLSHHETHEWHPSVDNNGMISYSRWDYVDRDSDIAHHIWLCYPDGRDARSYHGNYPARREFRPWMELAIRAVPDSHKYVAVAAPHHGENYGSLVLIDQRPADDDAMSQVKRVTPEVAMPESESAPGAPHRKGRHSPRAEVYGTPWPLSEDYYLCVYDPAQKHYGIYLVDSFGNRELVYRDPAVPCLDPIPFRPRPRPPIIPVATTQAAADRNGNGAEPPATIGVVDVYDSDFEWPSGTKITSLRIVQIFPKATRAVDVPRIGKGDQSLARGALGTVPVEDDGSAYFEAPHGVPVYFQALDSRGLAVQSMRSAAFVHRGERLICQGCHEPKGRMHAGARTRPPKALRRAPSKIQPEADGSYPLLFPRLVQGVLDRNCVKCHVKNRAKKAPDLS
ncbi:MAG: HzsA-related protein, partial [Planctomycetota bacterium]